MMPEQQFYRQAHVRPGSHARAAERTDAMTYTQLDLTGERLIPDLEQEEWNVQVHRSRYRFAAQFVRAGSAILDFGCGSGYGLHELAGRTSGRCVGVDKLEAVLYAQHRYGAPNIQYVAADVTNPGARFGKFDLIVSFDVIEHLDDIDAYLANMAAQLYDNDSQAIVSTPWSVRRSNFHPLHNPHHTCELSAAEFRQRLERHFALEELTFTMGMLARLRRKGVPVEPYDRQTITLSTSAFTEVEETVERYGQGREEAELLQHDLAQLSRRVAAPRGWRAAVRSGGLALRRRVSIDRHLYRRLPLNSMRPLTASLMGEENALAGCDLLLETRSRLLGGDVCVALYEGDACVAQVCKPAVLIADGARSRFLLPVQPDSKDKRYRLQVSYRPPAGARAGARVPKAWCTAEGEPCLRALYRRFEWPGPPGLMPAPKVLGGASNLPPLPARAGPALDGMLAQSHEAPLLRLQKLRRAYGEEGLAGIARTGKEFILWRLARRK